MHSTHLGAHESPLVQFGKFTNGIVKLLLEKFCIPFMGGQLLEFCTPTEPLDKNLMPHILVFEIAPKDDLRGRRGMSG